MKKTRLQGGFFSFMNKLMNKKKEPLYWSANALQKR